MIINDLTNPFFAELTVGCERILRGENYVVFLANTGESAERQAEVIGRMREQRVAGVIICPARGSSEAAFAPLHEAGIPVVQAMRAVDRLRASAVAPDNRAGAALAVASLASRGAARIAFAGGFNDTSVLGERLGGYRDGLAAAGLPFRADLVFEGAPTRDFGAALAARLAGEGALPDAILAFNDAVALGFCTGMRRSGLQPGKDVAVIGFDDVSEAAYSVPALSTVAVDPRRLGEKAAQMLLDQINAEAAAPQFHTGPVRLVIRET